MNDFECFLRGQADGQLLGEGDGQRFIYPPNDLTPQMASALKPWMSLELDPSYLKAYKGQVEAWTLFRISTLWFICRLKESGEYKGRPAYLAHAWAWVQNPEIPVDNPGFLFAERWPFLDRWEGRRPEDPPLQSYQPSWAQVIQDQEARATGLLAHLFDACKNNQALVILTDLDENDWYTDSRLSRLLAFAWAALPYEWKFDCFIQTSCQRPADAIEKLKARVVTHDYKKYPDLPGFKQDWIVWHPCGKHPKSARAPSEAAQRYAKQMWELAIDSPERVPVAARLLTVSDLNDSAPQAIKTAIRIARDIDPLDSLQEKLPELSLRLSEEADMTTFVSLAQICQREHYALDSELLGTLWQPTPSDSQAWQLATLEEPLALGHAARIVWAYCQVQRHEDEKAESCLDAVCAENPGREAVREMREQHPSWTLWSYLPPEEEAVNADWNSDLPAPIAARLRRKWREESPAITVEKAVNGGYWHRWARDWFRTADLNQRREMGLAWFKYCHEDSLLEDWYLALQLLRPLTIEVVVHLWETHGEKGSPVPLLDYLKDEQIRYLAEAKGDLSADMVQEYADKPYAFAFLYFGVNPRANAAKRLNKKFRETEWPPAPEPRDAPPSEQRPFGNGLHPKRIPPKKWKKSKRAK